MCVWQAVFACVCWCLLAFALRGRNHREVFVNVSLKRCLACKGGGVDEVKCVIRFLCRKEIRGDSG